MPQPASNPKIEELRFRVKTDPKSRLFYPLAEELRKVSQFAEAEHVLRAGLASHPTYLSAWVSLGRVLREQQKHSESVEALSKALQLDPGNVVAARLLADAYLSLGEKVEAIKKYKLVHALLPADEELENVIARLDAEINAPASIPAPPPAPEPEPEPAPVAAADESPFAQEPAEPSLDASRQPLPPTAISAASEANDASPFAPEPSRPGEDTTPWRPGPSNVVTERDADPIADAVAAQEEERRVEEATGDVEPMRAAHEESPFEEPPADAPYTSAAFAIEEPQGMHVARAPLAADVPSLVTDDQLPPPEAAPIAPEPLFDVSSSPAEAPPAEEADVFAPVAAEPFAVEPPPPIEQEDFTNTITMADLYARQGLIDDARHIYENILARDPDNANVREKLEALNRPAEVQLPAVTVTTAPASLNRAKIARLESWLTKVSGGRGGV